MIRIEDNSGGCNSCSSMSGLRGFGDTVERRGDSNPITNLFGGFTNMLPNFLNMASGSTAIQSTAAFEQIQAQEAQAAQNSRILITALVIGGAVGAVALIFVAKRKS